MAHETAGDPVSGLKWTHRTTAKLTEQLHGLGIDVCPQTVARGSQHQKLERQFDDGSRPRRPHRLDDRRHVTMRQRRHVPDEILLWAEDRSDAAARVVVAVVQRDGVLHDRADALVEQHSCTSPVAQHAHEDVDVSELVSRATRVGPRAGVAGRREDTTWSPASRGTDGPGSTNRTRSTALASTYFTGILADGADRRLDIHAPLDGGDLQSAPVLSPGPEPALAHQAVTPEERLPASGPQLGNRVVPIPDGDPLPAGSLPQIPAQVGT